MCQKCYKDHDTLLHREAHPKTEGTSTVNKNVTYGAWSKQSEEVLLMVCQVDVMAPDGSITQDKALIAR